MKTLRGLLNYVEIKTKVTSVFPFFMTMAYLLQSGRQIQAGRSVLFFFGMLCFDLTATTINNYADTGKSGKPLPFTRPVALAILLSLFALSAALGIALAATTDVVVLLAGGLCFLFGIAYSWGPVPISHGPYGEITSGFFYGVLIPFLIIYINDPSYLFSYAVLPGRIAVEVSVRPVVGFLLLSAVPFCLTANIMLANNICDVEQDIKVQRFTLPFYLKRYSLYLFAALYFLAYASVVLMVILGFLAPLSLLLLLTAIPVFRSVRRFFTCHVKEETFVLSVQNFLLIIVSHSALILLSALLPGLRP